MLPGEIIMQELEFFDLSERISTITEEDEIHHAG
ncbi:hypothetical protein FHY09_001963 [Xanthomonas sp. 60]